MNSGYSIEPNNPEMTSSKVTYIVQVRPYPYLIMSLVGSQRVDSDACRGCSVETTANDSGKVKEIHPGSEMIVKKTMLVY